jgi:phosphoribosylformylglycinamidine synthase
MNFAVLQFPGSNCDQDAVHVLSNVLGHSARLLWHKDRSLGDAEAVIIPGGFSYGDYLRTGAIARFSPVMQAVQVFAGNGGLVLGICNGFQILCEARLLPGVLVRNASLSFVCRDVVLRVERTDTPFTSRCEPGQRLRIPIKHGFGNFTGSDELLAELEEKKQIVLRYHGENPNGSALNIAGVVNEAGNVMGMMPHPEHAVDPLLGSPDGALILASLADAARERSAALV